MKKIIAILFIFLQTNAFAQNLETAKKLVDTLTSEYFWGRGYTKDGMKKAADFLAETFKTYGLTPVKGKPYFQNFTYSANSFPSEMNVVINGRSLQAGKDFIVLPSSKSLNASGTFVQADSNQFINVENKFGVEIVPKLTWSVANEVSPFTMIQIPENKLEQKPKTFSVNIANKFIKNFKAANVCAMVKGTAQPDSFLVITAHYDHLGGMGTEVYFPGANDNASGVALLLNLAKYYAQHPAKYSILFICFAGEEAGLIGSKYFTEHPLIPLQKIRFLINTDLAGTGKDGITVVNATEFPKEFNWLKEVNETHHLLPAINARGKAANSDHYFFTEKGVPSFFFYTLGGIAAYHDVEDVAETLPLTQHENLLILLRLFNEKLMGAL